LTPLAASTNYAAVIRPLQVLVMVVAVLFFLRIIRVVTVQARPTDYEKKTRRRRGGLALKFIEPSERSGQRVDVETGVTIGRGSDCDLSLQDTYLSSRHARLANDEGDLSIEDLGSTNGTYVNQELVKGRVHLERGDVVQVGGVLFEVVR
jgi:pSer/pThr/pTyr-binding forkhead associated (FHA) protein